MRTLSLSPTCTWTHTLACICQWNNNYFGALWGGLDNLCSSFFILVPVLIEVSSKWVLSNSLIDYGVMLRSFVSLMRVVMAHTHTQSGSAQYTFSFAASQNNPMKEVLLLSPFFRWRDWVLQRQVADQVWWASAMCHAWFSWEVSSKGYGPGFSAK